MQNVSCVPRGTLHIHKYALKGPNMFHVERSVSRDTLPTSRCPTREVCPKRVEVEPDLPAGFAAMAFPRGSSADKDNSVPRGT